MCKTKAQGYFLVTHGSSSPRSLMQLQELGAMVQQRLGVPIGYGCLEGLTLDLTAQIENFVDRSPSWQEIVVMPLFLWAGQHTSIDIPTAIQKVRRDIPVKIAPFLGSYPAIPQLLLDRFVQAERQLSGSGARLLIVHGSSYAPALEAMENLASYLHARLAFWHRPATIGESIAHLLEQSPAPIIVLPHFLFAGKITESIGATVRQYARVVYLPPPLTTGQVADLITGTMRPSASIGMAL